MRITTLSILGVLLIGGCGDNGDDAVCGSHVGTYEAIATVAIGSLACGPASMTSTVALDLPAGCSTHTQSLLDDGSYQYEDCDWSPDGAMAACTRRVHQVTPDTVCDQLYRVTYRHLSSP
jgi:hypothetical protein